MCCSNEPEKAGLLLDVDYLRVIHSFLAFCDKLAVKSFSVTSHFCLNVYP